MSLHLQYFYIDTVQIIQANDIKEMLELANRELEAGIARRDSELATLQSSLNEQINIVSSLKQKLRMV